MRNYLIAGIIALFVGTAIAGIPPASQPAAATSGFTAGQDVTGDDGVFKTLQSTGTAPSLTATGAVFKATVTVLATTDTGLNTYGFATEGGAGIDSGQIGVALKPSGGIRIGFNGNTGGNAYWDLINGAAHIYRISGTSELMRLNANGLGIGTASPNAKLDVTGSAMFGTGGTQSTFTATGFFQPYSRTTLQLSLLAPSAVGQYIDNSTLGALCRSTGTSAGNWALATAAGTGCF